MESQVSGAPSAQPSAGREGCGRRALIGCGVVALLLCAVVVGLLLYVRRNPVFVTDLMMRQIESHYGSDVTEEEKTQLRAAYGEFRAAVGEKRVNRTAFERLQVTLSGSRSNRLDGEQVRALTQAFRNAAATAATPSLSTPSAPPVTRSP